jgi:hypothetical protein
MYGLHAHAVRKHGRITVFVVGQLPDTCHTAEVVDKYPGGNRVYVRDPGFAQVFIAERVSSSGPCLEVLVPWFAAVDILDSEHTEVQVFVNEDLKLTIPVVEASDRYVVYELTVSTGPDRGCIIVPEDQPVLAIYSHVFGPASHDECAKYVQDNC